MKWNTLISVLALMLIGCSSTKPDEIYEGRYRFDRTFTLDDIAPVAPAYVELPYHECDRQILMDQLTVVAEINNQRAKRVYRLKGDVCVLRTVW
ncbi:TPA: hypothetical protein I7682_17950 [Vibrio vulnificus]|nr:hypothetical protein [Vibrio vulnificus]